MPSPGVLIQWREYIIEFRKQLEHEHRFRLSKDQWRRKDEEDEEEEGTLKDMSQ